MPHLLLCGLHKERSETTPPQRWVHIEGYDVPRGQPASPRALENHEALELTAPVFSNPAGTAGMQQEIPQLILGISDVGRKADLVELIHPGQVSSMEAA